MWRIPGQQVASKGHNERYVETIDIFPTIVELVGAPPLPKCEGIDQPPTVVCLQGESYAREFLPTGRTLAGGAVAPLLSPKPKQHAFSQWPFKKWGNETGLREGYTVRSAAGFRYTRYVPYNTSSFSGDWAAAGDDEELYDYNIDPWETTNFASNGSYATVVAELRAVLRKQYVGG
jgi:arylsulfatase A-like enzyme